MEKPTYTAIDYNSKENKVIEERIRNGRRLIGKDRIKEILDILL